MRKITVLILVICSLLMITSTAVHAVDFTLEPAANVGGLWHVENENQAYVYMRYSVGETAVETGNYYEHYTTWWGGEESDFSFNTATPKSAILDNPDPLIYTKFRVQIIANINVISGPTPIVIDILDTESVDTIEVRITDWADRPNTNYLYDYSFFDLYVDGIKVLTSRNISEDVHNALGFPTNPNFADITFGVNMYWSKVAEVVVDPDATDPWAELPVTTGNPSHPLGVWGEVSDWYYNLTTHKFSFTINYLETLYHVTDLPVTGDTDFITKTKQIFYFTDPLTGDRILYMNFSDEVNSTILKTGSISSVSIWEGEALWNLTKNEVSVTNVLRVYNYIPEIDSTGQVYSYFYMPDVPVDDLLSVTVNLGYQYMEKDYLWSTPEPGPVQSKTITLTKGESTLVNPTWVEDVYVTSFWTAGIAASLMVLTTPIGWIPYLGWGIAIGSFVVGGLFLAADNYEFFAYDVDQIQYVIPDSQLRSDIDSFIQSKDPGATPIDTDTNKLYKLNLGVLNDGEYPRVVEEMSSVTQIVWITNGKVYSATGDYVNDVWGGPGTEVPDISFMDQYGIIIYTVAGIAIAAFVITSIEKSLETLRRIFKNPKKLLIIAAIVFIVLYLTGQIHL